MHSFRNFILKYTHISNEEWNEIEKCLVKKAYKKGDLLLVAGQKCKTLYFLENGYLRFYVYQDGERVTKYFTSPPYCFTSQRSFANNIPADDNIEVLQDCVVWEMNKTDAFDLLEIPNWSTFVRKLIQEVQFFTEEILKDLQNKTAEERYIRMIEEDSSIINNVPLKYVASFLGIAPQSLSRIRKKYRAIKQKLT